MSGAPPQSLDPAAHQSMPLTFIPVLHYRKELGMPSAHSEEFLAGCATLSGSLETSHQGEEDGRVAVVAVQSMQLFNCRY